MRYFVGAITSYRDEKKKYNLVIEKEKNIVDVFSLNGKFYMKT